MKKNLYNKTILFSKNDKYVIFIKANEQFFDVMFKQSFWDLSFKLNSEVGQQKVMRKIKAKGLIEKKNIILWQLEYS